MGAHGFKGIKEDQIYIQKKLKDVQSLPNKYLI
jgi:hypothetical protein